MDTPPQGPRTLEEHLEQGLAAQIALAELVRLLLSEFCFDEREQVFRRKLEIFRAAAADGLEGRRIWPHANPATEDAVKGMAISYIDRIISSIRHPGEPAGGRPRRPRNLQ